MTLSTPYQLPFEETSNGGAVLQHNLHIHGPFFILSGFSLLLLLLEIAERRKTDETTSDAVKKKGGHKHDCTWKLCAQTMIERVEV